MTISKFSKEVLFLAPSYSQFYELDTMNQERALEIIKAVIGRLDRIGIQEGRLVGDNSMNVEVYNALSETSITPKVFNCIPPVAKDYVLDYMIGDDEERNKLIEGTFPNIENEAYLSELSEIDSKLMQILNSGYSEVKNNLLQPNQKAKIILMVMALNYLRIKFDESVLMKYTAELETFFFNSMTTEEEMMNKILGELDYYWEWTLEKLNQNRATNTDFNNFKQYNVKDEGYDELEEQDNDVAEVMELIRKDPNQPIQTSSYMNIKVNEEELQDTLNSIRERNEEAKEEADAINKDLTLSEALKTLSTTEITKSAEMGETYHTFMKLLEDYSVTVLKGLKHETNLLINFYISTTSKNYKVAELNHNENKILLNVDLKQGLVESQFKGQSFKLNGFFNRDEEVKINALEW